ncbi:hypothetical protein B0T20DRAFT_4350 [Sordaria brevicollis]|uniref:Uncharacterized protein n=1 Tax=Sordaria brevicollis TaxID=83679 RepID=A0AAE0UFV1_SORBR|nr:hypothetical protein B0T20DRAFT_4350 [Sordaria brevicollis]
MPRDNSLRHPPPAHVFDHPTNPVVESWLDTLPPLPKEPCRRDVKQWRRAQSGFLSAHRTWFIFSVIIRAISTVAAIVACGLNVAIFVESRLYWRAIPGRMIAVLVVAPIIVIWNSAELVTICIRKSRGIPAVYHAWADGILFVGLATTTGVVLVDLIIGIATLGQLYDEPLAKGIVEVALLILLMVLHSFLFFNYFCHKLDRHDPGPFVKTTNLPMDNVETTTPEAESPTTQAEPPFRYKSYEYYAKEDMGTANAGKTPDGGFVIDIGIDDMGHTVAGRPAVAMVPSEAQRRCEIPILPSVFSPQKHERSV